MRVSYSLTLGLAASVFRVVAAASYCSRQLVTGMISEILTSMVAHNPYTLPVAEVYKATENSHPAALGMMTAWRTIESAGTPSLLAIDTTNCTGYFALDVSEGNPNMLNVLRGRVAIVDEKITELELFINRNRGDHGFSFNSTELPANYAKLMNPPANRTKASRAQLIRLSEAVFANYSSSWVNVSDSCQFTELGWSIVDPGTWSNGSTAPLGCTWRDDHPIDLNARTALVVDEELGFVVTSGVVQGKVLAYQNVSAFIPNQIAVPQQAQEQFYKDVEALANPFPLVYAFGATGDTLEVLQYYNDELQALQINVYLSGPNMTSPWLL